MKTTLKNEGNPEMKTSLRMKKILKMKMTPKTRSKKVCPQWWSIPS